LVIVALFAWRQNRRGKLLALAVAWFYLSLAPVSNLIPLPGAMMGERFIYFTFAGMIPLLFGSIDNRVWKEYSRQFLLIAVVISTVFVFTNIARTLDWRDNYHFFKVLAEQEPENPVIQLRMAQSDLEAGNTALALSRLEQLVKADFSTVHEADSAAISYWYGKALLFSNRPKEALIQFSQTVTLSPKPTLDLILLQVEAAARSNELKTALTLLEHALKISPEESMLWNALGNVLSMSGNLNGAVDAYTKAVEFDPANKEAVINLQNIKHRSTNQ
jgi:tetratricopeptide (TPR) repeat protein